jgi:nucleoside-triphosphatase THEP1
MSDIISITAMIYTDSDAADRALRDVAMTLMERGFRLAGLVQHNTARPGRSRCDMVLEELASGELIGISQDRGPLARGCALDVDQLLGAMQIVRAALTSSPDLVILNKFGKTEAEGAGFRPLIAEAIEAGLPVLIAVPWRNVESWRLFTGAMGREVDLDQLKADGPRLYDPLGLGHRSDKALEPATPPLLAISTRH